MKEDQVVGVYYKVTTKANFFYEVMPIVQIQGGKFEVKDVLLYGGSGVNIIFKSLRKKIELRRLQLAPFVVQPMEGAANWFDQEFENKLGRFCLQNFNHCFEYVEWNESLFHVIGMAMAEIDQSSS